VSALRRQVADLACLYDLSALACRFDHLGGADTIAKYLAKSAQ
jgi:hypothetical protein